MYNPQINNELNNRNTLEYDEYIKIVHRAINMNCEDIIDIHNSLIGINDTNNLCKTEYGEKFIINILNYDFGYNYVKDTPKELLKFFNSKYTSDYLKGLINKYNNDRASYITNLLNSDKDIKDFNEDELYSIYKLLELYGLGEIIIALSFKLDSKGAIDFLNNKINKISLIKRIIYTSGLSARPEYYSNRDANLKDLNGKMLYSIFNKLVRLDKYKGYSMLLMTLTIDSLSASNFLENLYYLVQNKYNLELEECVYYNDSITLEIKEQFINLLPEDVLEYIKEMELIGQNKYNSKLKRVR